MRKRSFAVSIANIVPTPELVDRLIAQRPDFWPSAVFGSVLFQRMAAVEERRVEQVLATRSLTGRTLSSDRAVERFVAEHIRERDNLLGEVQSFIADPSFMAVFGDQDHGGPADGADIKSVANRLADFYVRFLELAEECQTCSVPTVHAELIHDCVQLMNLPIQDFGNFMNDFLGRFAELQQRAMAGEGDIQLEPVVFRTTTDDRLVRSVAERLRTID